MSAGITFMHKWHYGSLLKVFSGFARGLIVYVLFTV